MQGTVNLPSTFDDAFDLPSAFDDALAMKSSISSMGIGDFIEGKKIS